MKIHEYQTNTYSILSLYFEYLTFTKKIANCLTVGNSRKYRNTFIFSSSKPSLRPPQHLQRPSRIYPSIP